MLHHFMIVVDDSTVDQQNAVTNYLKAIGVGYFHHFSDLWLVTTYNDAHTVVNLRDSLIRLPVLALVPSGLILVHRISSEPTDWAGRGSPDQFKWLHEEWAKRE